MLLSFQHFNWSMFHLWKATFLYSRKNQCKGKSFAFHPQASVRCRCASYMYQSHLQRARPAPWLCSATALVGCREDDSTISEMCSTFSRTFFLSKQTCFFGCTLTVALLLCLFGGECQGSVVRPFLAWSPLSIVKVDVSEIRELPTGLPHPEK